MSRRGRGAPEEERVAAEQRRQRVASLYVRGMTQADISRKEGVTQKTISLDLKRIRQDWAKAAARDVGERTWEEIAKIDAVEQEAWEAWQRSKEAAESRSQEVEESLRSVKDEDGERTEEAALVPVSRKLKVSSKGQTGEERYLARIAWCIETRLRLLDAFPRDKDKKALLEAGDGSRVTVFIEDLHAPGTRTSREMEERLERERERLGGPMVVDQAPPPPPEPPRNGHHGGQE